MGIDLPLKALLWEDAAGQVRLGYHDVAYLARQHEASVPRAAIENVNKAVSGLAAGAVAP